MLNEALVQSVRFDLLHWPPGQSLTREVPTDVFSPNTLAHLRHELRSDTQAQQLIAMAETPIWSAALAEELFVHLQAWLKIQVERHSKQSR